jgi:hypothetical protein
VLVWCICAHLLKLGSVLRCVCRFLAVGGYDNTVRMLSLEDGTQLRAVATQAVNVSGAPAAATHLSQARLQTCMQLPFLRQKPAVLLCSLATAAGLDKLPACLLL